MTKNEAIIKVEEWLRSVPDGLIKASTPLPPIEAIKRVVREAKCK